MKSMCFTQVLEHVLIELDTGGLDYSIRKKLANRVWQVDRLKADEKVGSSKYHKKEKVAYVEVDEIENSSVTDSKYVEESEVNVAELKPGLLMYVNF